jgi:hypothetical protein
MSFRYYKLARGVVNVGATFELGIDPVLGGLEGAA